MTENERQVAECRGVIESLLTIALGDQAMARKLTKAIDLLIRIRINGG